MKMAFIDRDPEEMLRFAASAKKYASSMTTLIRGVQGSAAYYESELDDNCKSCIAKLNTDCNGFLTQVDVYYQLATQIEKKALRQKEIKPKF